MDEAREQKIRERAYYLWEKEGYPEGRDQEFWERASNLEDAPPAAPTAGGGENEVDETIKESFPASDPPSFTPGVGAGARDG